MGLISSSLDFKETENMEYEVIFGDSHVDIVWLPEDLFVSEAPTAPSQKPLTLPAVPGRLPSPVYAHCAADCAERSRLC